MWKRLHDETWSWKGHIVHDDLIDALEQELDSRSVAEGLSPVFTRETQTGTGIDLPGMIWTGRSYRSLDVEGLKFTVPSQDWSSILAQLKLAACREFADGTAYYKIHSRFHCIVFSQAQRDAVVAGMEAQLEEAEAEADHDNQRFAEAVRKMNEDKIVVVSARAEAIDGKKGAN